jgi:predicted transcriptional regulator
MEVKMINVKESSIELIKQLPDDCSLEDIQYELYAKAKIQTGLEAIEFGNNLSEEEMDKEINTWLR